MNRTCLILLGGFLIAMCTGCVDLSGLLDIQPNGSGTITLKIYNPHKNPAAIKAKKDRLKDASLIDKVAGGLKTNRVPDASTIPAKRRTSNNLPPFLVRESDL